MSNSSKLQPTSLPALLESNALCHASGNRTISLGCQSCFYRPQCGGLEVGANIYDCSDFCRCDDRSTCDNVCQNKPGHLVARIREVDGLTLSNVPRAKATSPIALPPHVPCIYHRSRREIPLESIAVAIPLAQLVSFSAGTVKFRTRQQLLDAFMLADSCHIIASGTDRDRKLERWWGKLADRRPVIQGLIKLGVVAATAPNYSVFHDVPRLDNLYNIKRIGLVTAEIQNEGLPCALHLNGRTDQDFNRWIDYLNDRPEIDFVATEFGTGAGYATRIDWHVNQLLRVAHKVRRPLRLIIRGGVHVLHQLKPAFDAVTLIDTRPFSKASHRQRAMIIGGRLKWQRSPLAFDEPIDQLLEENIEATAAALPLMPTNVTSSQRLLKTFAPSGAANDARHESSQLGLWDQLTRQE